MHTQPIAVECCLLHTQRLVGVFTVKERERRELSYLGSLRDGERSKLSAMVLIRLRLWIKRCFTAELFSDTIFFTTSLRRNKAFWCSTRRERLLDFCKPEVKKYCAPDKIVELPVSPHSPQRIASEGRPNTAWPREKQRLPNCSPVLALDKRVGFTSHFSASTSKKRSPFFIVRRRYRKLPPTSSASLPHITNTRDAGIKPCTPSAMDTVDTISLSAIGSKMPPRTDCWLNRRAMAPSSLEVVITQSKAAKMLVLVSAVTKTNKLTSPMQKQSPDRPWPENNPHE